MDSSHCGDPFYLGNGPEEWRAKDPNLLYYCPQDTEEKEHVCTKTYQYINGKEHVTRGCGNKYDYPEGPPCQDVVVDGYNRFECQCYDDGCNQANLYTVSMLAVMSAVVLVYLIQ